MDRTKINQDKKDMFSQFSFVNARKMDKIHFPCVNCINMKFKDKDEVQYYLLKYGII